jgi:hypothetical protein
MSVRPRLDDPMSYHEGIAMEVSGLTHFSPIFFKLITGGIMLKYGKREGQDD